MKERSIVELGQMVWMVFWNKGRIRRDPEEEKETFLKSNKSMPLFFLLSIGEIKDREGFEKS